MLLTCPGLRKGLVKLKHTYRSFVGFGTEYSAVEPGACAVSDFLLNLARRAGGLPIGAVQAAAPAPFAGEARAPDPDAIGMVVEPDAPPPDSSVAAPVAAPTTGEAPAIPAIQRSPATTEPAPPRRRS